MLLALLIVCFLFSAGHGLRAMVHNTSSSFSFPLYNSDSFTGNKNDADVMTRDKQRVNYLSSLHGITVQEDEDPPVSSIYPSNLLAIFEVGTGRFGRQRVALLVDPGSPLVWWQCRCKNCPPHQTLFPTYNPVLSYSFFPVYCKWADKCLRDSYISSCANQYDYCRFSVGYGKVLSASGVVSSEALYFEFNPTRKIEIIFGCVENYAGQIPDQASGILGLNGQYSLPAQLNASVFSFCVPSGMNNASSSLDFNIHYELAGSPLSITTKLLDPPPWLYRDFYYIGIKQVMVGSSVVDVPPSVWGFDNDGKGVFVDPGTLFTLLPSEAYSKFRDIFLSIMEKDVPELQHVRLRDSECYRFIEREVPLRSLKIPSISFIFIDGGTLEIEFPEQVLMKFGDPNATAYCLVFSPHDFGVLGRTLFQTIRLIFDLSQRTISFKRHECI